MHCESDQANLCWDCDFKVHGANFLVAKHNRTLLCHVCQSSTAWLASGRNLGSAVSVCDSCVVNGDNKCEAAAEESSQREYGEEEEEKEDEGDYDNEDVEETEEEEDAENQVVPWSGESSPLSMSKSGNEGDGGGGCNGDGDGGFGLKRMRENLSSWSDVCSISFAFTLFSFSLSFLIILKSEFFQKYLNLKMSLFFMICMNFIFISRWKFIHIYIYDNPDFIQFYLI